MILDWRRLKPTHKIVRSSKPALKQSMAWIDCCLFLPAIGLVEQFTNTLRIMFSSLTDAPATDEAMPNIHADIIRLPSLSQSWLWPTPMAMGSMVFAYLGWFTMGRGRRGQLPFADKGITEDMAMQIDDVRVLLKGNRQQAKNGPKEWPAVRLFTPLSRGVWLLSQIDPDDFDKAFGLCDDGDDHPVLGHVSLAELASRFGHMSVRWDATFKANRPLSAYAAEARSAGRICS